MNRRISVLVIAVAALAMAGILTIANANSVLFVGPPFKQTGEAQQTAIAATAEAGLHAPKPDLRLPTATEPSSCPHAGPAATYVGPAGPSTGAPPFFAREVIITSEAVVTYGGDYYYLWIGAPGDHPTQGLIRVLRDSADPCASHRLGTTTPSVMTDYPAPQGPLTATKVEANILFFSIAGGGTGRFDLVTGQYLRK